MFKGLLLAALVASQCTPKPAPAPDPAPTVFVPPPPGQTPCEGACARLVALGCPEGQPTPKGATCVAVCQNAEDSGVLSLWPDCVSKAQSCEAARACR